MEELQIHDPENLLCEIRAELMKQNAQEKERLIYQKLTFFALCLLVVAFIATAALCAKPLLTVFAGVNAATKTLSDADVDGTLKSIQDFAKTGTETFESVETTVADTTKIIDSLDMESLNSAIEKLNAAADEFGQLDFKQLNEAIANLNASVEPLAKFFNVFKKS